MNLNYWIVSAIIVTGMLLSIKTKKLTIAGAITGGVTGWLVFTGAGYTGIAMMAAFFLLATAATAHQLSVKQSLGLAETAKGKRTAWQVAANAGTAAILGLLVWIYPSGTNLLQLMIAASFAAATADTVSSELGNVYGKRFYNILGLKKDTKGLNGVISMEGTLFGIAGSMVIALIYAISFGLSKDIVYIIIAGTVGNITDSLLGATLERKGYLNNNTVNFFNTVAATLTAWALHYI